MKGSSDERNTLVIHGTQSAGNIVNAFDGALVVAMVDELAARGWILVGERPIRLVKLC